MGGRYLYKYDLRWGCELVTGRPVNGVYHVENDEQPGALLSRNTVRGPFCVLEGAKKSAERFPRNKLSLYMAVS